MATTEDRVYEMWPGGRIVLRSKQPHHDLLPVNEAAEKLRNGSRVYVEAKDGQEVLEKWKRPAIG